MPPHDENTENNDNDGVVIAGTSKENNEDISKEEQDDDYSDSTNSEKDKEIQLKFHSLAAEIRTSFASVFSLFNKIEVIKGRQYIVLSRNQEAEFTNSLKFVNETLGKAQTMLDSYIRLSNSTPQFDKFFNKYYIFNKFMKDQRKRLFYQIHARDEGKYMYPHDDIITELDELELLFSRLCGTLTISGDYYLDEPPVQRGMGNDYADGNFMDRGGYPPYNYPQRPSNYYDSRAHTGTETRKPLPLRDIGDE